MRMLVRMPSLANVAPGGTATLNLPIGRTYEKLVLEYGGATLAQMKNIRLLVDGKPIQEYRDGEELRAVNRYYERHDADGFLTLWFVRPEMQRLEHQQVTALGTGDSAGNGRVQTLQLEVDIDDAAASPTLKAHAWQSDPKPLGQMTKVKRFTYSSATAGTFEIDNIPKGPRLLAVHFIKDGGDISAIELEQNSRKVFEGSKGLFQYIQRQSDRTPQTDYITLDFVQQGDLMQSIITEPRVVQDQRFRLTLDSPGSVVVLVEYLDRFAGI